MNKFYKHTVLPRIGFIAYFLTWITLYLFRILVWSRSNRNTNAKTRLCIEAGTRGWESIEFKELFNCSCEFLSESQVAKVVINPQEAYLKQIRIALNNYHPTHYLYDPRTGSQDKHLGIWQAFKISMLLYSRGITPVVLLTDLSVRAWRVQSAIVTARKGIVITFMSSRLASPIFPHRRLLGPSVMPLSKYTIDLLNQTIEKKLYIEPNKAVFIGSLYEPRTSMLNDIAVGLKLRNLTLEVRGRVLGAKRVPDSEYWDALINSPIIITTAGQIETKETDWTDIPQLVYRYIEAMACGTLLVAPEVPGIIRYFSAGQHFASFTSAEDAVNVIEFYLKNDKERKILADRGRARAQALVSSRVFWTCIDASLGKDSLT